MDSINLSNDNSGSKKNCSNKGSSGGNKKKGGKVQQLSDKSSDRGSLSLSNIISVDESKDKLDKIEILVENLKERDCLLSKKINRIKEEDNTIMKFFECFNIIKSEKLNEKMGDKMFEKKYTEKFALIYNLQGFDYLPFLKISDDLETQTLEFFHISFFEGDKQNILKEYCFLSDNNIFTIDYEDKNIGKLYFIIEKEKNYATGQDIFSILALNSNNIFGVPKIFNKNGKDLVVSFWKEDFNESKLEQYYEIEDIYSKINDIKEKKRYKEKKPTEDKNTIENFADMDSFKKTLNDKIKEMQKLDEERKAKDEYHIRITIEIIQRELDGFYTNPSEISIKVNENAKVIPANSYILVEAKNHNKIKNIVSNLDNKKRLLKSVNIPVDKMFFIGILNTKPPADEIDQSSFKIDENCIILYTSDLEEDIANKYYCNELRYKRTIIENKNAIKDIEIIKADIQNMQTKVNNMNESIKKILTAIEKINKHLKIE